MARLINTISTGDIIKVLKDSGVVPDIPITELKMHLDMDLTPEIEIKYTPEVFDRSKPSKLTKP
jgi:hypothetical protein